MALSVLTRLDDRAVRRPAPADEPTELTSRLRKITARVAFDEASWSDGDRLFVTEVFDARAPTWHERRQDEYRFPLEDALERSSFSAEGPCIEIGSGTGLQTPVLASVFEEIVSVDVAPRMLAATSALPAAVLARADAADSPFETGAPEPSSA